MFCDFQLLTGAGVLSACICVAFIAYKHNTSRTGSASGRGFRCAVSPVVASFRSSLRRRSMTNSPDGATVSYCFSRSLCSFSLLFSFFPFCFPLFRSGLLRRFLLRRVLLCFTILYQNGTHNAHARARDSYMYKKSAGGFLHLRRVLLFSFSGSVRNIESGGVIVAVVFRFETL